MDTENKLLDKVREACSIPSDNALSMKLGVTRALVSHWRKGRSPLPDATIAQLCAMAKLDGAEWLAAIHAERATDARERALWVSMLDRLRPAAVVAGLAILLVGAGAPLKASADAAYSVAMHIMSALRGFAGSLTAHGRRWSAVGA